MNNETPLGHGNIFVVSAPSGAGKTSLVQKLLSVMPDVRFSVSYTTRAARANEVHGVNYFFVPEEAFVGMVNRGELVEWARVHGNYYGTAHDQIQAAQEAGEDVVLDIDVQGHLQVRQVLPQAISIFILPPSRQELERRLVARHSNDPDDIQRRLEKAPGEIAHWREYDYIVVNDDLERATQGLVAIVRSTRLSGANQAARVAQILRTFGG